MRSGQPRGWRSGHQPQKRFALVLADPPDGQNASRRWTRYVTVPADRYRGAQTQRSLQHFSIGDDRMPKAVYHAQPSALRSMASHNAVAFGRSC